MAIKAEIANRNKTNVNIEVVPSTGVGVTSSDKSVNTTVLTIAEFTQAVTNANIAFGKKICTMPKKYTLLKVILDITYKSSDTQTTEADMGLGTALASGAQAALSAAGDGAETLVTGQTATKFNGTTEVTFTVGVNGTENQVNAAGDIYLNLAGAWEATRTVTYSGTVTLIWSVAE